MRRLIKREFDGIKKNNEKTSIIVLIATRRD